MAGLIKLFQLGRSGYTAARNGIAAAKDLVNSVKNGAQTVAAAARNVLNPEAATTEAAKMTFQEIPVAEANPVISRITHTEKGSFEINLDGCKFRFKMRKRIDGKWKIIALKDTDEITALEDEIKWILKANKKNPKDLSNITLDFALDKDNNIDLKENISLTVTYKKGGEDTVFEKPFADIDKTITIDGKPISLQVQIRKISELFTKYKEKFLPENPQDGIDLLTATQAGEGTSAATGTGNVSDIPVASKFKRNLCWHHSIYNALRGFGLNGGEDKTPERIAEEGARVSRDLHTQLEEVWEPGVQQDAREALKFSETLNQHIEKVTIDESEEQQLPTILVPDREDKSTQATLQELLDQATIPNYQQEPNQLILHINGFRPNISSANTNITINAANIQGATENTTYNLRSFLRHSGSLESGHWTAYVLEDGQWYKYDSEYKHLNIPYRSEATDVDEAFIEGCMFFFTIDGYQPPEEPFVDASEGDPSMPPGVNVTPPANGAGASDAGSEEEVEALTEAGDE